MIKVVRGNPTPEELAAALAVVRARAAARSEPAPGIAPPPPSWSDPARIARRARRIGCMLWSDPENEPPKEMRDMQAMMRRAGMILAFAMVLWMIVSGIR